MYQSSSNYLQFISILRRLSGDHLDFHLFHPTTVIDWAKYKLSKHFPISQQEIGGCDTAASGGKSPRVQVSVYMCATVQVSVYKCASVQVCLYVYASVQVCVYIYV